MSDTLELAVVRVKLRDAERIIAGLEQIIERLRSNELALRATVKELQDVVTFVSTGRAAHARTT